MNAIEKGFLTPDDAREIAQAIESSPSLRSIGMTLEILCQLAQKGLEAQSSKPDYPLNVQQACEFLGCSRGTLTKFDSTLGMFKKPGFGKQYPIENLRAFKLSRKGA